ncbi:MAG: hypothetical protein ACR2FU_02530 [Streptosporangiaceae bacterium]
MEPGDDVAGIGIAYVAMLTAFYVDNSHHLPRCDLARPVPIAVVLGP